MEQAHEQDFMEWKQLMVVKNVVGILKTLPSALLCMKRALNLANVMIFTIQIFPYFVHSVLYLIFLAPQLPPAPPRQCDPVPPQPIG